MRTGWTIAALLLALALCLAGCAPGGGRVLDVSGERKALGEAVDGLFAALDARDGEAVAALCCHDFLARDIDIQAHIEN